MPSPVVEATKRINAECAEKGDVKGARALLEKLVLGRGLRPTLVTANVLIKTYRCAHEPEGAELVVQRDLPAWNLRPDGCTYSTIVDAYGLAGRVNDAYRVVAAAEAANLADARVYATLLRFVEPDDVETLCERVSARGVPFSTALCNGALSTLAAAGRPAAARAFVERHMASPLLQQQQQQQLLLLQLQQPAAPPRPSPRGAPPLDARSYSLLLQAHCKAGDVAGAEALLSELYAARARLDATSVSVVRTALVSQSPPDLGAAYRLLQQASVHGIRLDAPLFNSLIKGYAATVPPQPQRVGRAGGARHGLAVEHHLHGDGRVVRGERGDAGAPRDGEPRRVWRDWPTRCTTP